MSIKRRAGDKDANWFYRFSYKGKDYCEGGFPNKQQAGEAERLKRNSIILQIQHPEDYAGEMTFRAAVEWWLKEIATGKSSRSNDHSRLSLAASYFENRLIRDIKPQDVDAFLKDLYALRNAASKRKTPYKISDHTRNHYREAVHALYERLKFMQMYRGDNPVAFTRKIAVPQARCRFMYPAEEKLLTPAVALDPVLFAYYRIGIESGMRIGEIMSTRIKHVDLAQKHIFIPKPKNLRSRYVPLDDSLLGLVASLKGEKGPEDHLLPECGYTALLQRFYAVCGSVGIQNLKIHDWRHTFAYNLLSQGVSIYKVSLLLGHSSVDVTQKHYGHLAAKDLRDAMESAKPFLSCNRFATADQVLEQKEA